MKTVLKIFIVALMLSSAAAFAGSEGGNGGDRIRARFLSMGQQIVSFLKKDPRGKQLSVQSSLDADALASVLNVDRIRVVQGPLADSGGSLVDAVLHDGHLLLDQARWTDALFADPIVQELVFHEMLRLTGVYQDGNYRISKSILGVDLSNPDATQTSLCQKVEKADMAERDMAEEATILANEPSAVLCSNGDSSQCYAWLEDGKRAFVSVEAAAQSAANEVAYHLDSRAWMTCSPQHYNDLLDIGIALLGEKENATSNRQVMGVLSRIADFSILLADECFARDNRCQEHTRIHLSPTASIDFSPRGSIRAWTMPDGKVWTESLGVYGSSDAKFDRTKKLMSDSEAMRACANIGAHLPTFEEYQTLFAFFDSYGQGPVLLTEKGSKNLAEIFPDGPSPKYAPNGLRGYLTSSMLDNNISGDERLFARITSNKGGEVGYTLEIDPKTGQADGRSGLVHCLINPNKAE